MAWEKEAVVIHRDDLKDSSMLRVVIGHDKEGLAKSQYLDKSKHSREVYHDADEDLLDPAEFDIPVDGDQEEAPASNLEEWNKAHPVGSTCSYRGINTQTRSAGFLNNERIFVYIKHGGMALPVEKLTFAE